MAIIFISVRKKQQMFLWGIFTLLLLAVVIISFVIVLPEFKSAPDIVVQEVYSAPDVKVNFTLIDSEQVKSLESFSTSSIEGVATAGRANPFSPNKP
jgi:hypothetical protein